MGLGKRDLGLTQLHTQADLFCPEGLLPHPQSGPDNNSGACLAHLSGDPRLKGNDEVHKNPSSDALCCVTSGPTLSFSVLRESRTVLQWFELYHMGFG